MKEIYPLRNADQQYKKTARLPSEHPKSLSHFFQSKVKSAAFS
jgi:hypothetical protein